MRSSDWIKLDKNNLPDYGRKLVTNGAGVWAVDAVHKGKANTLRGEVFAFLDGNSEVCNLTHYAPIAMPWDS